MRNFLLTKKKLTALAMCSLLSTSYLSAQVIEGEDAGTLQYTEIGSRTGFSGGKGIEMRACFGSMAVYEFAVTEAGTYDLAIDYATMQDRAIYLKVNNQVHSVLLFDVHSSDWSVADKTKTVQIYLEAGENTITLGGYETSQDMGYAPPIDKLTITKSATTIAKPAAQIEAIVIETEDADVRTGNFEAKTQAQFSGGKGTGGNSGYAEFSNVQVAEEGTYDLVLFYANMDESRKLEVKVNQQVPFVYTFKDKTDSWGESPSLEPTKRPAVFKKTIQVYLKAGSNKVRIAPSGAWTPNIDKLEIVKAGISIQEPAIEYAAHRFDFTDKLVAVTEQNVTTSDNLKNLFDNSEATVYQVSGKSSTQISVELAYPIILTNYSLQSPTSGLDVSTWLLEYSINGTDWTEVPKRTAAIVDKDGFKTIATTFNHDSADKAAKYFRLTATGTGSVEIGEWQLHGQPCVSVEQAFPDDLISKGTTGTLTAKTGYNKENYPNAISKSLNNKYTLVNNKQPYLQYQFNVATKVNTYELATPWSFPTRDPKIWTMEGSDDGTEWTVLDTRTNIAFPGRNTTLAFNFENETAYLYYKLNVTTNGGDVSSQILQWQMYYNEEIVVNTITPAVSAIQIETKTGEDITVSISPANASNSALIWAIESESETGVVELADGKVKGLKKGTARLRVTSASNPLAFSFIDVTVQDEVVSIDEDKLTIISVYPNPVVDQLNIDADSNVKSVLVFDASGKLVHTQTGVESISTSAWSQGVYLVKIETESNVTTHKVVKQ